MISPAAEASAGPSIASKQREATQDAASPTVRKDVDDVEDDDRAEDSNTMDFLSDPIPLEHLPLSDHR